MPASATAPTVHRSTFRAKKTARKGTPRGTRKGDAGVPGVEGGEAAASGKRAASLQPAHQHGWYLADVEGKTLGRAATKIASVLRGKHLPTFTPHVDAGDYVVVINADKVKLTKDKWNTKIYYDHSLFPGGLRMHTAAELNKKHPGELVRRAVWGMLPKGPLGRRIVKKLKIYAGATHRHANHQPKVLNLD